MRNVLLAFACMSALALTACEQKQNAGPESASGAPTPPTPLEKLEGMRPADEATILSAWERHDSIIRAAPNSISKDLVQSAEDKKFCDAIGKLRSFNSWTALVHDINKLDENGGAARISFSLNGSAGYLVTDDIPSTSPLYKTILLLSPGDSYVTLSGTLLPNDEVAPPSQSDGSSNLSAPCEDQLSSELEAIDVRVSAIDPL